MIDLTLLRENPERIIAALSKKDPHYDIAQLIALDKKLRVIKSDVELLRCTKNELAKQGRSGITPELREQSVAINNQLKEKEQALEALEHEFNEHYLACPNILLDEVPAGNKEENFEVSLFGEKPTFSFTPKNHLELGEKLGWLDFQTAAKIGGASLALYKGEGVALLFSLAMFISASANSVRCVLFKFASSRGTRHRQTMFAPKVALIGNLPMDFMKLHGSPP